MNNTITASQNASMSKISSMPDENLYNLCKQYGERARIWRQRFAGLLPEVFKRKLYERKGFLSIFEFAKKLAGMSEEQVRLVLNLEKRFEEMPRLKSLLTDGKVSVNKLSRIVSIARPENEIFLANQVQILSKSAVETLVRDEKFATKSNENSGAIIVGFENQSGLQKSFFSSKSLPGQTLELSKEVEQKLIELKQKGIDINEILLEFLRKREQEIAQKKEELSRQEKPVTRHIPVVIKRIIYAEHGTKCSIKNCKKPSEQIHHTQRFAAVKSHNPRYLEPLCKEHHELEHSTSDFFESDIAYREIRQRIKSF